MLLASFDRLLTWCLNRLNLLARKSWSADRFAIPEGMDASTIENSSHIAEAYRCAIIACLHATLDMMEERERGRDAVALSPLGLQLQSPLQPLSPVEMQMQQRMPYQMESQLPPQSPAELQSRIQLQSPPQPQPQSYPQPHPQSHPPTPSQATDWAYLHALLPAAKAEALTDCLAAVARVPLGSPEEAGLLPLLFIVACETSRQDQAKEAVARVEALGNHIGLGNVRCASMLLRQIWYRRSTQGHFHDWRGLLAKVKWDLIIT